MHRDFGHPFGFPALPDASSLVVDMLNDPEALKAEKHDPGLYDENGDYYPQYSDDPEYINSLVEANSGGTVSPGRNDSGPNDDKANSVNQADNSENVVESDT